MRGKYHHCPTKPLLCSILALSALAFSPAVKADFKDDIDYTKLKSEYGATLPTGQGIKLLQVEALRDGAWATPSSGEVASKTFTYFSSTGLGIVYSSHASEVAAFLGGNVTSMTPGVDGWGCFESSYYVMRSLYSGRSADPVVSTWDVENHSWGGSDAMAPMTLQKMDFRIDRDNTVVAVGLDNGATLSDVMANAYNVIAVGTATGDHPHTGSTVDGVGRMKPDLVGTATWTSYATPMVSSSAVLLLGEVKRTQALAAARSSMVIKSILMAGASKAPFSSWTNSSKQPLDSIYGAGELNIYNSYKILIGGQQAPLGNAVNINGWDSNTTLSSGRRYFFSVPAGKRMTLSTVLAWNRHVTPGAYWFTTTTSMQNLDLVLWQANSGFTPVTKLAESVSAIDNVEHIYQKSLPAGNYALDVVAPVSGEKYGLAWKGDLTDDASTSGATSAIVTTPTPPPVVTVPVVTPTGVLDSSFESVGVSGSGFYAFAYNPTGSAWTFSAASGLTANGSGFTSANPNAPDGALVAFIQNNGSISQNVVFSAGTFALSAQVANRANWGAQQTVLVYVDNQQVGTFKGGTAYSSATTNSFTVTAGTHSIALMGTGTGDCTLLVDKITLAPATISVPVSVGNSGFETSNVGSNTFYAFVYNPATVAGSQDWTFDGSSGVAGNNSGFTSGNPSAPDGTQVAFLQSNVSAISQTLVFPSAGTYVLSVSAAQRGNWNMASQVANVYLDGALVGTFSPSSGSYQTFTITFTGTQGSHKLSLNGATPNDSTLFLDHVSLVVK